MSLKSYRGTGSSRVSHAILSSYAMYAGNYENCVHVCMLVTSMMYGQLRVFYEGAGSKMARIGEDGRPW